MTPDQRPEKAMADLIRKASDNYKKATRDELATVTGVSVKTFDRYMAGIAGAPTFTIPQLINIATILDIPVSALLPDMLFQDAA
jgi:transcriptional regulator with XRE-family HTH domain